MKRILSAISSLALLVACSTSQPAGEVTDVQKLQSPDGVMEMTFQLTAEGTPQYALNYDGKKVILPSDLGFELRGVLKAQQLVYNADGTISKEDREPCNSFYDGFSVESVETATFDETWEPVWGEEARIRNNYNELLVNLIQNSTERKMAIRFRLYNDGLGFRYEFPYQKNLSYFVIKEETARNDKGEKGWLKGRVCEIGRRGVSLDVVDRNQRNAPRVCQRLRKVNADEKRADQSRIGGNRHGADIGEGHARLVESAVSYV